jgi:hypothetical protein
MPFVDTNGTGLDEDVGFGSPGSSSLQHAPDMVFVFKPEASLLALSDADANKLVDEQGWEESDVDLIRNQMMSRLLEVLTLKGIKHETRVVKTPTTELIFVHLHATYELLKQEASAQNYRMEMEPEVLEEMFEFWLDYDTRCLAEDKIKDKWLQETAAAGTKKQNSTRRLTSPSLKRLMTVARLDQAEHSFEEKFHGNLEDVQKSMSYEENFARTKRRETLGNCALHARSQDPEKNKWRQTHPGYLECPLDHPFSHHYIEISRDRPLSENQQPNSHCVIDLLKRHHLHPVDLNEVKYDDPRAIFRSIDRVKLLLGALDRGWTTKDGEEVLSINPRLLMEDSRTPSFLKGKVALSDVMLLHNEKDLKVLRERWSQNYLQLPWSQPVEDIGWYFGWQIALYYAFLGLYTKLLGALSLVGIVAALAWGVGDGHVADPGSIDAVWMVPYAMALFVWGAYFFRCWMRLDTQLAVEWGLDGMTKLEDVRPEYVVDFKRQKSKVGHIGMTLSTPSHPVTKDSLYYIPVGWLVLRKVWTGIVSTLVVVTLAAVTASVYYFKWWSQETHEPGSFLHAYGPLIADVANAVQIIVLNDRSEAIAEYLNDYESHRTDTDYDNNLVSKIFLYQFVNSYSSLVFIGFVKNLIGQTCEGAGNDCLAEMRMSLLVILLSKMVISNVVELKKPLLKTLGNACKRCCRRRSPQARLGSLESITNQYLTDEYTSAFKDPGKRSELRRDYAELVIQYGFIILFGVCSPLTPVICFFSNWVELRVDSFKLCGFCDSEGSPTYFFRRPVPRDMEKLGTWVEIIIGLTIAGMLTNTYLVVFVSNSAFLDGRGTIFRLGLFIAMEHVMLFVFGSIQYLLPETSVRADMQIQREKWILQHMIDGDDFFSKAKPHISLWKKRAADFPYLEAIGGCMQTRPTVHGFDISNIGSWFHSSADGDTQLPTRPGNWI